MIFSALPSVLLGIVSFNDIPRLSSIKIALVKKAISCNCLVLRSPKEGALVTTTLNTPRNLFTTIAPNTSCSMSSHMIKSGLPCFIASSKNGTISFIAFIFLSVISTNGLSNTA